GRTMRGQCGVLADHRFSGDLDPYRRGDENLGAQAEAEIVGFARTEFIEDSAGWTLQVDRNFGRRDRQPFAGADIEWHACPAPIVDVQSQRSEGLDLGVRRHTLLIAVAAKLATHDLSRSEWPHRVEDP